MNISILYKSVLKNWYDQNYAYLHASTPNWLATTLTYVLDKQTSYKIYSPSANKGKHEEDAYATLSKLGYQVSFYVSDLLGESYYRNREDYENFHFLHKNQRVQELNKQMSYDIIMDCKGALWYALRKRRNRNAHVVEVLSVYEDILSDDTSILLVDAYTQTKISLVYNYISSFFHLSITKFRENSTGYLFKKVYGNMKFHELSVDAFDKQDVQIIQKMNLSYLTRKEITSLKEEIMSQDHRLFSHVVYDRKLAKSE